MRSESDPRGRIAWQPETPMSKALWENGSLHEASISTTGSRSSEGCPTGIRARASISGIVSILGMLLEPGEPAQASFGGHRRAPPRKNVAPIKRRLLSLNLPCRELHGPFEASADQTDA